MSDLVKISCFGIDEEGRQCLRTPLHGKTVCAQHDMTSGTARKVLRARLYNLQPLAIQILYKAMSADCVYTQIGTTQAYTCNIHGSSCPDWKDKIGAAKALLDRTGMGPKTTLALEAHDEPDDLTKYTAQELVQALDDLRKQATQVIDVTPTGVH